MDEASVEAAVELAYWFAGQGKRALDLMASHRTVWPESVRPTDEEVVLAVLHRVDAATAR